MKTNNHKTLKVVCALATTFSLASALANHVKPVAGIGQIAYAGTGCKEGSVRLDIGSGRERGNLVFHFDNYSVSTDGREMARASCNLAIPINVPTGYALVMPPMALKGYARIQTGDRAKINTEIFVAGARGDRQITELDSSNDGVITAIATSGDSFVGPCGAGVNLRLNSSVFLNGNYNSGSYVNIDKLRIPFPLKLVSCSR